MTKCNLCTFNGENRHQDHVLVLIYISWAFLNNPRRQSTFLFRLGWKLSVLCRWLCSFCQLSTQEKLEQMAKLRVMWHLFKCGDANIFSSIFVAVLLLKTPAELWTAILDGHLGSGRDGRRRSFEWWTPSFLGLWSSNCCSSWVRGTVHPVFRTVSLFSKYFLPRGSLRSGLYSDLCALFIGLSTTKDWNSHLWVSGAPGRAWGVNIISAA